MLGFCLFIAFLVFLFSRMWKENNIDYRKKAREKENARLDRIFNELAEKNRRLYEKEARKQNERMWRGAEKELKEIEKQLIKEEKTAS